MENKANITSVSIEKNRIGIKLSIIVPVYNIIQYLPKCLDSILSQTLRDIEIICVDDCSTDNSLNILEEYSLKDFDNSIKESISSVEAMCQILTKNSKATLGDALKLLKDKIHPAMKSAFEKLYGYTSDANGIRHANGLGEGDSTFEEAKYMLISCSAFINYLKENFEEGK